MGREKREIWRGDEGEKVLKSEKERKKDKIKKTLYGPCVSSIWLARVVFGWLSRASDK